MMSLSIPIRCPAFCVVIGEHGEHLKGYLTPSKDDPNRMFCLNSLCKFAYRDEHNKDHWMGGVVPLDVRTEEHEEFRNAIK